MMQLRHLTILGLCALILFGCAEPAPAQPADSVAQPVSYRWLVTPDPNATATPTPFQPETDQAAIATSVKPAGQASTPTLSGPSPTPTTVPLINRLKRPDRQVNILIFGSDYRPQAGYRTDVIMLLSIYPKEGKATLTSFPRDLYVDIPGWTTQRLNTAQAHGGFALTQKTFEENFGVHPDHYIMTNFNGFRGIINTLGGIDVYASKGLSDKCDLPQGVNHYCSVSAGQVHMDADFALWYVRARYSTSDFDRTRRAQEVIRAIFTKLLSLNAVSRAPELYNDFKASVETDLALTDLLPLLPLVSKLSDLKNLDQYAVGTGEVTSWVTPEGAQVLVPNKELIFEKIIRKAAYNQ